MSYRQRLCFVLGHVFHFIQIPSHASASLSCFQYSVKLEQEQEQWFGCLSYSNTTKTLFGILSSNVSGHSFQEAVCAISRNAYFIKSVWNDIQ